MAMTTMMKKHQLGFSRAIIVAVGLAMRSMGSSSRALSLALTPAAPPRFDVFSERLVGSWTSGCKCDDNNADDIATTRSVEEVMRSCGGAVQGIREPFWQTSNKDTENDDSTYLNRANDGFVFFDSGQYSFGPVRQGAEPDQFLTNFMVGSKCRLTLSSCVSDIMESSTVQDRHHTFLTRTLVGRDDTVPTISWVDDPVRQFSSIALQSMLQCSMPSPGQPWVLQRVKWQKEVSPDVVTEESTSDLSAIQCWIAAQPASDFSEWLVPMTSNIDDNQTVLHMGTYCKDSGQVQIMARGHNFDGALATVTLFDGKLRET